MACLIGFVSRMADNRVSIRTSDILEKLAATREARIAVIREHVYNIDPGMRLAREICCRETLDQVVTTIVIDYIPDRAMPPEKSMESFPPPASERVFDAFDIWAGLI